MAPIFQGCGVSGRGMKHGGGLDATTEVWRGVSALTDRQIDSR